MPSDAELLRRYAVDGAEDAFAEIVRRHLDLVYAVALRRVGGDAHLARDVTQRVFCDVASKARSLAGHAVLEGWLHRATQFAATDIVRSERRRRGREQKAHTMLELSPNSESAADWESLRPVLDEVIAELAAPDRDAIVMRFFGSRAFAEIGAALRLTEDAARRRVDRALEKLADALRRRGITSTTAGLAIALGQPAAISAPAGLAAAVTSGALASTIVAWWGLTKVQWALATTLLAGAAFVFHNEQGKRAEAESRYVGLQEGRAQVAALRRQNAQLARAETEAASLRADDFELARLREEVRQLAERLQRPPTALPQNERRTVIVSGKVKMPGRFELPATPTTLGDLLRRSGGWTETAKPQSIRVTRMSPDGKTQGGPTPGGGEMPLAAQAQSMRVFTLDATKAGKDDAFVIEPGDIVYVPEAII